MNVKAGFTAACVALIGSQVLAYQPPSYSATNEQREAGAYLAAVMCLSQKKMINDQEAKSLGRQLFAQRGYDMQMVAEPEVQSAAFYILSTIIEDENCGMEELK